MHVRLGNVAVPGADHSSRGIPGDLFLITGLCALYYATAKFGFLLAVPPGNVTAVWLPSGIALAAVLTFGYRLWPGIWIGSLILNASFLFNNLQAIDPVRSGAMAHSLVVGSAIASGSTLEVIVAAYLFHRLTREKSICESGRGVITFATCSGAISCLIGATVGVGSLFLGGFLGAGHVGMAWLTWWLGDTTGILLVTPLLMTLRIRPWFPWSSRRIVEVLVLFALVIIIGFLLFGGTSLAGSVRLAVAYLVIPILIWPAFRFTQRETAIALFVVSAMAYWGTMSGHAPFGNGNTTHGILLFQGFVGVTALTTLTLSTVVAHRRRVERSLYRYKTASIQTADHWMLTDLDGTIRDVNPSFETVTGYSAQEVVGRKPDMLNSGKHEDSFFKEMWNTVLSGRVYRGVVVNRRKNGELFYELKTITPIRDEFGRITQLLSLGKDVTDVKETESELRITAESLEHANEQLLASESALIGQNKILESVLNSMKEGVVVANEKGEFVLFNRSAEQMVGIGPVDSGPGEWVTRYGTYSSDTLVEFPVEKLPLVRALQGEETHDVEMYIRNPENTEGAWLSVSGQPVKDESGAGIGGLIVLRDVTARKRVEVAERELSANKAELRVAKNIQKKLFPDAPLEIPGYDLAGATYPAVETGGDYFDYLAMPDGRFVALIGDVSGHGFGPALLMASTRAYLHALLLSINEVPDTLEVANRLLANDTAPEDFVTLILIRIDPEAQTLEYASAGHTTCYIFDLKNNIKTTLDSTGPPLGVVSDMNYGGAPIAQLEQGDMIVLMTDGVIEAECIAGGPFGEQRAIDTVRVNSHKSAAEIVKSIRNELFAQCQTTQDDDITVVVIKVL